MTMTEISRIDQHARRSRAVVHGGVYLAGQVADDQTAPIAEQTRQALAGVIGAAAA